MTLGVLPWLTLLRDLSVKSALLLLSAWALALAMRRASAAARHLLWRLTFAALLLLPLLSVTLPPRPVAVLPAAPPDAPLVLLRGPLAPMSGDRPPAPNAGGTGKNPEKRSSPSASPRIGGGGVIPRRPAWPALLGILWLAGVALAAFPLIAGWLLAVQRIRRCAPVTDPSLLALAREAGRQLGVRRPVSLCSGPRVAVPVTFGLRRPVILLPDGAASWPAARLRVALLHELAHVRRGDWAAQTMARLVCALFWHNPLVWPAARLLRAEAERACDDLVLSSGILAPDYALHLLAVAAALSGTDRPLPLAVPMAGRTPLESRLRAVLSVRSRCAPSRRLTALALASALVLLVPLAALRPAARAARQTVRPWPPAPAARLASPKAVQHSPAPVKTVAARPAPVPPPILLSVPTLSTPKGVPPMKLLTPVKTAALAVLAAGLALPAAHAQPTAPDPVKASAGQKLTPSSLSPVNPPAAPTASSVNPFTSPAFLPPNPPPVPDALPWNKIVLQHAALKTVMAQMSWRPGSKIPEGVKHIFYLLGDNAILVHATPAGFAQVQEAVKRLDVAPKTPPVTPTAPRQVQIKFEWVSAAGAANAASDKSVDALTIMAEEGRKAQVSSQHLRNGVGGQETITVVAHLKPGGIVTLDITEHSDTTARAGETVSNDSQTTVSVKDSETGSVGGLVSKQNGQNGQSAQRMLFVTPTIVHPAADGSVAPRSAPLQDGDIINVNPFTASPLTPGSIILVHPAPNKAP